MTSTTDPIPAAPRRRHPLRSAIIAVVVIAVGVGGAFVLLHHGNDKHPVKDAGHGAAQHAAQPLATTHAAGITIAYPAFLREESPNRGDRVIFLAQQAPNDGQLGTSMLIRSLPNVGADLANDANLLDAQENLAHPGRHLDDKRRVDIDGATQAYELVAEFPDPAAANHTVRKVDIIARTQANVSYHEILVGSPERLTDSLIAGLTSGLHL